MNVLNCQAGVGLIEPDRGSARSGREVNELLEVLSAGRARRVFGELEYEVKDLSDILSKVGDVLLEGAIVDREEPDLVVLERHELGEMGRADGIQIFCYPMRSRAQQQLYLYEGQARPGRQDHQKWTLFAAAADVRGSRQGLDFLGAHVRVCGVDIQRVDKMFR